MEDNRLTAPPQYCSEVIVKETSPSPPSSSKKRTCGKKRRGACVNSVGPPHVKLCDNCRGKHSWWKAISQIILATIRKCGGVKWRFHMQMCQWERSGTLPNSSDPRSPALVCFMRDREAQRDRLTLPGGRRNTGFNQASITGNLNNTKMRCWFSAFTIGNNHTHTHTNTVPTLASLHQVFSVNLITDSVENYLNVCGDRNNLDH